MWGTTPRVKRWVLAAVALVGVAGCSVPVAGEAVPGPTSSGPTSSVPTSSVPVAKPEVVRWMNNFCAVADYMIASGGVTFDQTETDQAAAKKGLSESLGRVVDVLDVVLHDLDELTPAPQPAADTAVEVIAEPLTRARDKFTSARSAVDTAPELTMDVYRTVLQDMTEAVTVMNEAVEKMAVVSLPDEFKDAGEQAENCRT